MTENIEAKRAIWHSRRGMLELDVLLLPFAQEAYTQLGDDDQARYRALLDREDPDLFTWFMEHSKPDDPDMERIVTLVLEHARNRR
ncbi:MAG: succinate dehydrogenase assembly factor 2 [Pseudomonadota bacterium]|nr:succinate dehydrogenase assembly factor 2 [Pseudomonadota bacterium]